MPAKKKKKDGDRSGKRRLPNKKLMSNQKPSNGTLVNKRTLESLKESQRQLKIVLDAAHMGIWEWDIIANKVTWSGSVLEIYGLHQKTFTESFETYLELVYPDDRDKIVEAIRAALDDNKNYHIEHRIIQPDGTVRSLEAFGNVFRDKAGKPVKMTGTVQDVSTRVKAEESLRDSEQRFRTLQQASFGGIGLHDHGVIIDCNQGLSDLTGYSYEELIGLNGLGLIAPEWRDFVFEKIKTGYDKPYDVEGIRKDGTRYFLEIHGKDIPYQNKTIRVTEFRDITERKRTEEKITEQNARLLAVTEDLKRKNNQLEEFTQIVSHNLRSPVGNILTLINFFEGASTEEEKNEYFALLKEAGFTTLTMLNELNEVLKIKQSQNIEKQELKFENILYQVKSMLNAKITELDAQVTFDFSRAPVIVYSSIYLESIILNLLDNALKYHATDRKPEIQFTTYKDKNDHIILEAKDNGLGINLDRYKHQIFKLRKTFHRHPESRGIGLFMIKNQIETMGGEITISSEENKGTTFFINFNKHQTDGS